MNLVFNGIAYLFIAFSTGIFLMGIGRKIVARFQRRYGPPLVQPLYDILKLFTKTTNISHGYMMDVAIIMLLGGTLLGLFFFPNPWFNYFVPSADFLVLVYLLLFPSLGMAMGVGEAANPNGSIGISRALSMLVGYDFVFLVVTVGLAMAFNGDTFFPNIISAQQGGILNWNILHFPFLTIAAFLTLMGMLGKKPFEVMVAPHEIATGPMVEFGGKYMGFLFLQHSFALFLELGIFVNLFLGGGTWYSFIPKIIVVFVVLLLTNVMWSRFRTDDAVRFFWKYPLFFALIDLIRVVIV